VLARWDTLNSILKELLFVICDNSPLNSAIYWWGFGLINDSGCPFGSALRAKDRDLVLSTALFSGALR
jgi:hypothetical protein